MLPAYTRHKPGQHMGCRGCWPPALHGGDQHFLIVLRAGSAGIGDVAVVFEGAVNHFGKPRGLYPHAGQPAGQAQAGIHVAQGLGNVLASAAPPLTRTMRERARAAFLAAADADGRVSERFEILTLSGWRS